MATTLRARMTGGWDALLARAERRLPALTRHRRAEALPIALHSRRIYVVPTGFGFFFAVTLLAMLIGALNFGNNPALLLTFLIAGAATLSVHRTVGNMRGISLVAVRAAPVHAGETLSLHFDFVAADASMRTRLRLVQDTRFELFDLAGAGSSVRLDSPALRRGWQRVGRATLSTEYPFGLFYAWSVLHPDTELLVYPRPEAEAPPLPRASAQDRGRQVRVHGEDWYGLRDYRAGDAQRLIAWKASARQDRLLVKEFSEPMSAEVTLDWQALGNLPVEVRIARLTRWVLESHAQNLAWRLVLPHVALGPARGDAHLAQCLRDLALLP